MNTRIQKRHFTFPAAALVVLLLTGWSTMLYADNSAVVLTGAEEVPQVKAKASGSGQIVITPSKTVSGSVRTVGIAGTMAHIHTGHPGQSGPVVINLDKTGDNIWSVPEGAKLPDAAYKDFEAGNLYVNIHSDAHPNGEIRGQIASPPWVKDESRAVPSTAGGGY